MLLGGRLHRFLEKIASAVNKATSDPDTRQVLTEIFVFQNVCIKALDCKGMSSTNGGVDKGHEHHAAIIGQAIARGHQIPVLSFL